MSLFRESEIKPMIEALKFFLDSQLENSDYDRQLLIQLYNDTDDNTVLQILARFHETLVECIQKIERALDSGENRDAIWKAAHKIAGTAELVGFASFGHKARELSHTLKDCAPQPEHEDDVKKFLQLIRNNKEAISSSFPNYREYLL